MVLTRLEALALRPHSQLLKGRELIHPNLGGAFTILEGVASTSPLLPGHSPRVKAWHISPSLPLCWLPEHAGLHQGGLPPERASVDERMMPKRAKLSSIAPRAPQSPHKDSISVLDSLCPRFRVNP